MNITMVAVGSRGDIQPSVALGSGLQAAGHRVTVATHSTFAPLVRSRALEFALLRTNPRAMFEGDTARMWAESGRNVAQFFRGFAKVADQIQDQLFRDTWEACQGADAVLYSPLGYPGYHVAERLGIPAIPAFYLPASRTRAFPSALIPPQPSFGRAYNRLTYLVVERLLWLAVRAGTNRSRQRLLGLPPDPASWFDQLHAPDRMIVYGFSPTLIPPPADWPARHHVTGYWFLDRPDDWRPPDDLLRFLDAGPPPVYIGFGSTGGRAGERVALAAQALRQTGQRGLLLAEGGVAPAGLPAHMRAVGDIPYDWLFPRVAAVLHHGGAGTTAAVLRAGVPGVALPFFGDQAFWGQRAALLGAALPPLAGRRRSVRHLAEAIDHMLSDRAMRARAAAVGQAIRQEQGVRRAVALLGAALAFPVAS